jgi:hypothetical protein
MTEFVRADSWTLWSGLDIDEDDQALARGADFSAEKYLQTAKLYPTVVDRQRYELLATDRHGGFGSKLLTAFTWDREPGIDEASAQADVSWSLLYRFASETGPPVVQPFAIYMVGVNPPPGLGESERASFIEFYTGVHVFEVSKRRHCTRATVYELNRELLRPNEGAPEFLGVYEVEDEASVIQRHVGFGYSRGPAVWQKHKTPWRLWYRRLPD